ncbi:MAG: pyridoxamine 5'-phosphate oxidase family protein [Bifidobacteriaceae bacterium]|jgi:uncharacterized pyridoxamine 5'-phosphate oxidase family protein|nr:pyridoxamine 5'-phosphate oxidase family protein [Bifidobacteriaceae bacterium]
MDEVFKFLKAAGHYFLATEDGAQPRVRPLGTAEIFEGKLYIQTGQGKNVAQQMLANPKVELCAYDGTTWLRVAATVVPDDRIEAQAYVLSHYPELAGMYQPGDGNTLVLYLKDATATFYSFTDEPRVVTF